MVVAVLLWLVWCIFSERFKGVHQCELKIKTEDDWIKQTKGIIFSQLNKLGQVKIELLNNVVSNVKLVVVGQVIYISLLSSS